MLFQYRVYYDFPGLNEYRCYANQHLQVVYDENLISITHIPCPIQHTAYV